MLTQWYDGTRLSRLVYKLLLLESSDHVGTAHLMFAYMKCFDRSSLLFKLMVIINSSYIYKCSKAMSDNLVLRKVYKLSMRIKMELFNGISWPRKLCVVQQDDVVFSPARAASRHFYSNFQKISTLQKILLAIPSGRVSAPYLYSYLELNCNSFTKMNSFEKILSLALEKYFHFHYLG